MATNLTTESWWLNLLKLLTSLSLLLHSGMVKGNYAHSHAYKALKGLLRALVKALVFSNYLWNRSIVFHIMNWIMVSASFWQCGILPSMDRWGVYNSACYHASQEAQPWFSARTHCLMSSSNIIEYINTTGRSNGLEDTTRTRRVFSLSIWHWIRWQSQWLIK